MGHHLHEILGKEKCREVGTWLPGAQMEACAAANRQEGTFWTDGNVVATGLYKAAQTHPTSN